MSNFIIGGGVIPQNLYLHSARIWFSLVKSYLCVWRTPQIELHTPFRWYTIQNCKIVLLWGAYSALIFSAMYMVSRSLALRTTCSCRSIDRFVSASYSVLFLVLAVPPPPHLVATVLDLALLSFLPGILTQTPHHWHTIFPEFSRCEGVGQVVQMWPSHRKGSCE